MSNKKVVTVRQLEILIEFMENHKDFARGQVRSKEGRVSSQRLWKECANSLNAENCSSYRDSKDWNKFYNDYKCRLKNKIKKINNNQTGTGGGPAEIVTLSPLEERLAAVLAPDNFLNLPAQHNPVPEPENASIEPSQNETNTSNNEEFESVEYLEEPSIIFQDQINESFLETPALVERCSEIETKRALQEINCAPSKSSAKRHKAESEVEKTRNLLLEIEKERVETIKAQIAVEKDKIEAIHSLANAVWTIANHFSRNSLEKKINKRRRDSSLDRENDFSDD